MMKKKSLLPVFVLACTLQSTAQGTIEDYLRAYELPGKFGRSKVVDAVYDIHWRDESSFTYNLQTSQGMVRKTGTLDGKGGLVIADSPQEPKAPQRRERQRYNPPHGSEVRGPQLMRRHWMVTDDERQAAPAYSPDSLKMAFVREGNLFVCDKDGKNERQLSFDGTLASYYSAYLRWSPDSRWVATCRVLPVAEKRYVYYVESSPLTQLQPILHQQEYAKPGDALKQRIPCVFEVASGNKLEVPQSAIANQYDLRGPDWMEDSKSVTFEYNQRGHQLFSVMAMDVPTGKVRTIVEERSQTYVNYNRYFRRHLHSGKEMLWMSERDGWNHLYLIDVEHGRVKRQITKGEWGVRRVVHVDENKRQIFFSANGMVEKEDPYLVRYYRIGFDGKGLTCLTPETGNHEVQFNDSFTHLVDTWSTQEQPPQTVVRSVQNPHNVQPVAKADISALKQSGWVAPEVFSAPGRDGKTLMWGIIQRPTNFDPSRKYPIIEYIYAGPGDAYTPKSFLCFNWNTHMLAELGFIVVQLDAMGTSFRGKAFEEVCYKNLRDAGFPDRKAWIKAAAEKYAYMDTLRVGIYGCSAGGQESTAAVLWHGDFYKAAYSACGCHDNRMDKIWWNEQWMGWPVDSSYVRCSNVENAHLLNRPLMLVVGEKDDNVDPASTMQLADALIRAGKDFELIVIPGARHTMGESYGDHKRFDFFVRHLLGKTPPAWDELARRKKHR